MKSTHKLAYRENIRIFTSLVLVIALCGCKNEPCGVLISNYDTKATASKSPIKEPYYSALPKRCHKIYKNR